GAGGPDGSPLDVDGDDLRVFVAFLQHAGVLDLPDRAETAVATRSGVFTVRREGQEYAVDMGPWAFPGGDDALADGFDLSVIAEGLTGQRPGLRGNRSGGPAVGALQGEGPRAGRSLPGPARGDPGGPGCGRAAARRNAAAVVPEPAPPQWPCGNGSATAPHRAGRCTPPAAASGCG